MSTPAIENLTRITHEEFIATLTERFGDNPNDWAFVCPLCGDVATGADMKQALADHPRVSRDGEPMNAAQILGQECIGRTIGALSKTTTAEEWNARREAGEVRGCDWAAYGLFGGPLTVVMGDGSELRAFRPATRTAPSKGGV